MDRLAEISFEGQEADESESIRLRISVGGIVQGVGFRPFVYRLAQGRSLSGYVLNNPEGVEIEIEGPLAGVSAFLSSLVREAPPQARIDTVAAHFVDVTGARDFVIRQSRQAAARKVLISPDIATCQDCLRELRDPADRRHRYPFINCTNCGPRYTIIKDIPYDRSNTTMNAFPMCPECLREYEDPSDRRFHAEPNACWVCGPKVNLKDADGRPLGCEDPIREAAFSLRAGRIVAVKGLGGFHLAVDATNEAAVRRLRRRKNREEKPLAIMAKDAKSVASFAVAGQAELEALESPARPIVLLRKRPHSAMADSIAPGNRNLGVMLPYTPVHHLLLGEGFRALVMTSANLSEEPIVTDIEDARSRLRGVCDLYLDHNREILSRCDDSVVRVLDGAMLFLRRSRGYVPLPISIENIPSSILACGAHLKNTVAVTRGNQVFLSQHIGDLENLAAYDFFRASVEQLQRIVEVEPQTAVFDLHPDYLSTRFAQGLDISTKIGVQHHHAHIASCLGEAGVEGPVIGIALDGTGYGPDGTVWGGEIMVATRKSYERVGHFERVGMPGGEAAIKQPWRMALSYLCKALGEDLSRGRLEALLRRGGKEVGIVRSMVQKGVNCPLTSSCGRLFDAISCLCGIRDTVSYEGQAAIELEMQADLSCDDAYPVNLGGEGKMVVIPVEQLIREVVRDLAGGVPAGLISAKFHNWLAASLVQVATVLRDRLGIGVVALSGGCFQNEILLRNLRGSLAECGFEVLLNRLVPANDGGISFGQVVVAAATLEED